MQKPVGAPGWTFARWEGLDWKEVTDNSIVMNGNKSLIAVFVRETANLNDAAVPLGTPESAAPASPAPSDSGTTLIETPVKVPQAAPALPKTGGLPMGLMMLLGGMISAGGLMMKKRN